jgi:hypothetical protein
MFIPKLLEPFSCNEFSVFDSSGGAVNRGVSLLLDFLVNFPNFPAESFGVEVWVIDDNEISEMLGDDFLFLLLIGVEFKGTVEDSSIIESGNKDVIESFFGAFHVFGRTASHKLRF